MRTQNGRTTIPLTVTDGHSPIVKVEYSSDGQIWHAIFPVDGLADSREERYELTIEGTLGVRGLVVRAVDTLNNVSTAQINVPRGR